MALARAARESLRIGDIAATILRRIVLSNEGAAEFESFHQEVCDNRKRAFSPLK
jgi:hypothetical protein